MADCKNNNTDSRQTHTYTSVCTPSQQTTHHFNSVTQLKAYKTIRTNLDEMRQLGLFELVLRVLELLHLDLAQRQIDRDHTLCGSQIQGNIKKECEKLREINAQNTTITNESNSRNPECIDTLQLLLHRCNKFEDQRNTTANCH